MRKIYFKNMLQTCSQICIERPLYISSVEKCHMYADFMLQKMKYRNHHLAVENKNLRNTIKNLECKIDNMRGALSQGELQCNLLAKNLHSKEKELQQSKSREKDLNSEVKLLQSNLCKESLRNRVLNERIKQASSADSSNRAFNEWTRQVIGRIRRFGGKRSRGIKDKELPHDITIR
ncbi:uncharacterized protein [Acropora muricata]|uniref:uncharacterized protein LOC114968585 n=1 Tax=Acropora millepora TaxID=45264 RepID=UPI0010FC6C92|nr:uncharacterized protein LOC114968585 [Acropora millepora]